MGSFSKYETYVCTRCRAEVPWYEPGEPAWRDFEYERKICSACRRKESAEASLPAPLGPCPCGSVDFVRAPLSEHMGEAQSLRPLECAGMPIYVLACRACARAELRVHGLERARSLAASNGVELVRFETTTGPYR